MNPCERILKDMEPAIRTFHTDRWAEDDRPIDAETLYLRYLEKHAKHVSDLLYVMEYRREEGTHAD